MDCDETERRHYKYYPWFPLSRTLWCRIQPYVDLDVPSSSENNVTQVWRTEPASCLRLELPFKQRCSPARTTHSCYGHRSGMSCRDNNHDYKSDSGSSRCIPMARLRCVADESCAARRDLKPQFLVARTTRVIE